MGRNVTIAILSLVGFVVVAGLVVYLAFRNEVYTVVMTQCELQQRVDTMFPVRKTYLGVFEIEYSNPKLVLDPSTNRVRASVDALTLFTVDGKQFKGNASVSSSVRYVNAEAAFYLDNVVVDHLSLGGVPGKYLNKLDGMATSLLQKHFMQHPVYVIRDDRMKTRLAKALLKTVQVQSGAVIATLGF